MEDSLYGVIYCPSCGMWYKDGELHKCYTYVTYTYPIPDYVEHGKLDEIISLLKKINDNLESLGKM